MGTAIVLKRRLQLTAALAVLGYLLIGQNLYDQVMYEVFPSCEGSKPAVQDRYFLKIRINSINTSSENLEVLVNGTREVQFHVDELDLPFTQVVGPYPHTGDGGIYNNVTLRSLDSGLSDDLLVGEAVCGYFTHLGNNNAGYHCTHGGYDFIAQAAPDIITDQSIPQKQIIYVLVDRGADTIARVNKSGLFKNVTDLVTYEVHVFSLPYSTANDFANAMEIGLPLDSEAPNYCYAFCGVFDATVDCSSFDLALSKELADPEVVRLGDTVTYAITVYNEGLVTAYDIVVRDMIPEGLSFHQELNPGWTTQLEYHTIDSITAGKSATIYLRLSVDLISPFIQIINEAEIIFGTRYDNSGIPTFDVDSTPANEDKDEDDQDDAEITILENLCNETFVMDYDVHPPCAGGPIQIDALVFVANYPVSYVWVKDGKIIGTEKSLVIPNPGNADYGMYGLTVIDAMGCLASRNIQIEPITNVPFACISEVNLSVNEECGVTIPFGNLILKEVSGLEEYDFEVTDSDGNQVDLTDLDFYNHGDVLTLRVSNPCTGATECWIRLKIEYKLIPSFELYNDTATVSCIEISVKDPTGIIDAYNESGNRILSPEEFMQAMELETCIGGWDVEAIDVFGSDFDDCDDNLVWRIYTARSESEFVYLDTAYLRVSSIDIHAVLFPDNLANVSCQDDIDPGTLFSNPLYVLEGDTLPIRIDTGLFDRGLATLHCNAAINYTDEIIGPHCSFGANKILRKWMLINWCTDEVRREDQFLFIIDEHGPEFLSAPDTVFLETTIYTCFANVDLGPYLEVTDNCDPSPEVGISSTFGFDPSGKASQLPIGIHQVVVFAMDACHNRSELPLVLVVSDGHPPTPILLEDLVVTMHSSQTNSGLWLDGALFDAGSHDFYCGDVRFEVARKNDIDQFAGLPYSAGSVLSCGDPAESYDFDGDGIIQYGELFRQKLLVCCTDIGKTIEVVVRVFDDEDDYSEASTWLTVDYKEPFIACNDSDPCTVDDRQYGQCPCSGSPDQRDFDQDGIPDCSDPAIELCSDGSSITVSIDEAEVLIEEGALPGPCDEDSLRADIGGKVYTIDGDMIEGVEMALAGTGLYTTENDGVYAFTNLAMYTDYEVYAHKDDNPLNGVTALDLVRIQEHILGLTTLSHSTQVIAADVNGDQRVSALDLYELRSLILGIQDGFRSNTSWRFVVAEAMPADETIPFPFVEILAIQSLDRNRMDENWVGIKIGDVTGDARPNELKSLGRSKEDVVIVVEDRPLVKGEETIIDLSLDRDLVLDAFQLQLDLGDLSFRSLQSGQLEMGSNDMALHSQGEHSISMVWYTMKATQAEKPLLHVNVQAQHDGRVSEQLKLSNAQTPGVLYDGEGNAYNIRLDFVDGAASLAAGEEVVLYQNKPNPFDGSTIIEFKLPVQSDVQFSFYNLSGELLHQRQGNYEKGLHSIQIDEDDLNNARGLIYYQMTTGGQKITRSMVVGVD